MPKIKEMWAWVAEEEPGEEGVIAYFDQEKGWWHPLMGADRDRIESYRGYAQAIAGQKPDIPVRLIKFDNREVLEEL